MSSSLVIKVKHGESLRRFSSSIDGTGKLDLDMVRLRKRIAGLFNFHPVADFTLTYTDQDGDLISLVDEDDLGDILKQSLNPLRITVKLNGSFSPITSLSNFLQVSPNLKNVQEILKYFPESFYETLSKLPLDLAYEAVITAIAEIIQSFTKIKGNYMNPLQKLQVTSPGGTSRKNDQGTSERFNTSAGNSSGLDMHNRVIHRKLFQSTIPDHQYSQKVQNIKESNPVAKLPYKYDQGYGNTSAPQNRGTSTAILTQGSEDNGGFKCARCGIQILSGPQIGEGNSCKLCIKVASIKIRGHTTKEAYIPSTLNRVRLQRLNSCYLGDLGSISDGTILAPSTRFTKVWKMKNNGLDIWPAGTVFRFVEGDTLIHTEIAALKNAVLVGREFSCSVTFVAPRVPGQYVSFWSVTAFGIPFGEFAPVFIQVADNKINNPSTTVSSVSSSSRISDLASGKNGVSTSVMSPKPYLSSPSTSVMSPKPYLSSPSPSVMSPNPYLSSPKVDYAKLGTGVEKPSKGVEAYSEMQKSKEVQNSKESKPVSNIAGGTRNSGASETLKFGHDVFPISAKESENPGGYQCSRCGVQVVSGRQYKVNFHLSCKMCFKYGNSNIERQAYFPSRLNRVRLRKISSSLIDEFSTISEGAVLAPSTPFTKIWRMRNDGSEPWPKGTKFAMVEGDLFSKKKTVSLQIPENGLPVGKEIDIVVNFIAPEFPGQYVSFWKVTAFGEPIGKSVVAFIQVAAPLKNGESKRYSCFGTSISFESSTTEFLSGKNDVSTLETAPKSYLSGQKVDGERIGGSVKNSSEVAETCNEKGKEAQNLKDSESVTTSASDTSSYDKEKSPSTGKSEATNKMPKESGNERGYRCSNCGVQIVSGHRFKISEEEACKRCFEVENRKNRSKARVPSLLDQARLQKINSSIIDGFGPVLNGDVLAPSTTFTKFWRMRNNGSDSWPKGSKFTMVGGDVFTNTKTVTLEIPENGLPVGGEILVSVDFIAPEIPGEYVSFWHVTAFGMPIGEPAVAFIQVAAPHLEDKSDNSPVVDLNAPHEFAIDLNASPESGNSSDSSSREVVVDLNASTESGNSSLSSDDEPGRDSNVFCQLNQTADIESLEAEENTQKLELPDVESPNEGSDILKEDAAKEIPDDNVGPNDSSDSSSDKEVCLLTDPDTAEAENDNLRLGHDVSNESSSDEEVVRVADPDTTEAVLNENGNDNLGLESDVSIESSSDEEVVQVAAPDTEETLLNAIENDNLGLGRDVSNESSSDEEVVHVAVPVATKEATLDASGGYNLGLGRDVSSESSSDEEVVHVAVPVAATEETSLDTSGGDDLGHNITICSDSDEELVHVTVPAAKVEVNLNGNRDVSTCGSSSDEELVKVSVPVLPKRSRYYFWQR